MGDAMFYLRAQFPEGTDMEAKIKSFGKVLEQYEALYWDWQNTRDVFTGKKVDCAKERENFKKKYPEIAPTIDWVAIQKMCYELDPGMNCCACQFSDLTKDREFYIKGNELRLNDDVYDNTTWEPIAQWLRSNGATKVVWACQYSIDPFEGLQLY